MVNSLLNNLTFLIDDNKEKYKHMSKEKCKFEVTKFYETYLTFLVQN